MKKNKKLAISIPTYNRAEFLDYSLAQHVAIAQEHSIEIVVSDNASTDNTAEIVDKWKKIYPLIVYYRNKENLGFDRNFELALNYPDAEYVWLLGDTYIIPREGINKILNQQATADVFVFNLGDRVKINSNVYEDCNKVLVDLSGVMSCVSCSVFSKKVIAQVGSERHKKTNFFHTGMILEYIALNDFVLNWFCDISVLNAKLSFIKRNWSNTDKALDIGVEGWVNFIFSLPITYKLNSKLKAAKEFGRVSGLLTAKGLLLMRSDGVLNHKSFYVYARALSLSTDGLNFLIAALVTLMPSMILRSLINWVKSASKKEKV